MIRRPSFSVVRFVWLCCVLVAGPGRSAVATAAQEVGRPVLRHYTPGEHMRGYAHQRVTQDAAGFMYFANDAHLLCYDGARWHFIELPSESAGVRQFAVTDDGTFYLAGAGVLGYLRGSGADARFVSLAEHLPPAARNIDELRSAVAVGQTVYFSDAEKILCWRDGEFTVLPYVSPSEGHGARLHRVGDAVYVTALEHGLGRILNDRVEPVADAPVLRENQILAIAADERSGLLLLTAEQGFHRIDPDGSLAPWPTAMDRWLAGKRIYCARRLADGSWVMGFSAVSGDGGLRFDPQGRYVGSLDTSIGLVVKTVRDFFPDREGGLWLGMDQGVARLEWPSPVSVFDSVNGLGRGAVADVLRHEGVLYAATSEGFFRLLPADGSGRTARFERVANSRALGLTELFRHASAGLPLSETTKRLPHFALAAIGPVARLREEPGPTGPVLWACGATGLARVEGGRAQVAAVPLTVRLTASGVVDGAHLPTKPSEIVFGFVAPRQRPTSAVTYQSRLVGLEENWSDWSAQRTRAYSRLPSGSFRFEVRARDAAGIESAPAILAFTVRPPWWAAWWALASYGLAGAGAIAGFIRWRTRALRLRAEGLEAVVDRRTAELARQNAELVRLNRLELDERIAARLAEEKARLEVLRYQLNPHFLFNTLASISAALPAGGTPARTMVERLAEFCRLTLHRSDDREWTTLGDEMRLLRTYLEIERSRWGELLDLDIACDPALEDERLPHFLLLPLVENALKYGRATSPDRVGLRLAARRAAGALVLEVANTGDWVEPTARKNVASLGVGLDNLRERLVRYYPRAHRLDIVPADGWVTVTLHIATPPAE
jgi:signal transduction histidine kinase